LYESANESFNKSTDKSTEGETKKDTKKSKLKTSLNQSKIKTPKNNNSYSFLSVFGIVLVLIFIVINIYSLYD
ncbi:MAG: hypothetical protein MJ252_20125, partial [archaeon]|nr:hypothetical protein [archaeon]